MSPRGSGRARNTERRRPCEGAHEIFHFWEWCSKVRGCAGACACVLLSLVECITRYLPTIQRGSGAESLRWEASHHCYAIGHCALFKPKHSNHSNPRFFESRALFSLPALFGCKWLHALPRQWDVAENPLRDTPPSAPATRGARWGGRCACQIPEYKRHEELNLKYCINALYILDRLKVPRHLLLEFADNQHRRPCNMW